MTKVMSFFFKCNSGGRTLKMIIKYFIIKILYVVKGKQKSLIKISAYTDNDHIYKYLYT